MSRTALLLLALGAAAATACRDATPVAKPDAGVTAGAHPVLADAGARSEGAIRGDAVPAGSLHAVPASSWVFAVFHADPAARAPRVKTGVFKPGRGARAGPVYSLRRATTAQYAAPEPAALDRLGRGLDAGQRTALTQAKAVELLHFGSDASYANAALRDAEVLAWETAVALRGFVHDEETGETFTPQAWKEVRIDAWNTEVPRIAGELVLVTGARTATRGMAKLGLPDLAVASSTAVTGISTEQLLHLAAQTIVERGELDGPGRLILDGSRLKNPRVRGQPRQEIAAEITEPGEGEAENRMILLRPLVEEPAR